jgi:hypothetical protein
MDEASPPMAVNTLLILYVPRNNHDGSSLSTHGCYSTTVVQ